MEKLETHLPLEIRQEIVLTMLNEQKEWSKKNDPSYVPNLDLMIMHMQLLKNESKYTQELYLQVIARSFGNKFVEFLAISQMDDVYGYAMTKHNLQVQLKFILAGINFQKWLSYDPEEKIEVIEYEIFKDKDGRWRYLQYKLDNLLNFLENTPLYGSIRKDCMEIQKNKTIILSGDYAIPEEWRSFIFPKYWSTLGHLGKVDLNGKLADDLYSILNDIKSVLNAFSKIQVNKKFMVRLWKRNPLRDLLQGNFSDCCVSIGEKKKYPAVHLPDVNCRKFPAGILNYLTDVGIQVAEVHDVSNSKIDQIGQCWLYVSLDDDGKPMLVADSFDFHSEYRYSKSYQAGIRKCMFDFLKKYAAQCGITK
ncbi:MAG: hypothetical protein Q7K45_00085, partial [Nanoarchaeota archaeon]|nr:hypothetical protein [Nanoarchaeota archaeon]